MKNVSVKEFETERLLIKRTTAEDLYGLWNILKQREVNKYYMATPSRFKTREEFEESLNNWEKQKPFFIKGLEDDLDIYKWSIFLKDGTLLGKISIRPLDEYIDNPEIRGIGWYIDPKYQGKGYMTEAARTVLDYMFSEVEINKITDSVVIENIPSWSLMEKLGLERVGIKDSNIYDENGNRLKSYIYEITREKYLELNYERINEECKRSK